MQLQLFYPSHAEIDLELETYLENSGFKFESFYLEEHKKKYDHSVTMIRENGGGCFCELPDPNDPLWPKLFNGYKHIASGPGAIRNFDISSLK